MGEDRTTRVRRVRVLAILAAVALVIGGAVVLATREPDTVRSVRDFLTAAQRRDPQRALEIAGFGPVPTGDFASFLNPEAMSEEWEIRSVTEQYQYSDEATVQVVIAGPDGREATTRMELTRSGEAWVIEEPFAYARVATAAMTYLDVNGFRAPADRDVEYALLPGFYRFYTELPDGIEARFEPALVLPAANTTFSHIRVSAAAVTLAPAGEEAVQHAVNAYIDTCVQTTELATRGCPFGADPRSGPLLPEYGYLDEVDDVEWSVVEYPIVAVVASPSGVAVTDRRRGLVQLRVTGHDADYRGGEPTDLGSVELTVECEMITSDLVAGFDAAGTVRVAAKNGYDWDTCDNWPLTPVSG